MTQGVRESLLGDAIDRELLGGVERSILADGLPAHHETGALQMFDQRVKIDHHGLGSLTLGMTWLPQKNSHVTECFACGYRDGRERRIHGHRIGFEGVSRAIRLRDHHRERVRDDIKHVPGDTVALLLDHAIPFGGNLGLATLLGSARCASEETQGPRKPEDCVRR